MIRVNNISFQYDLKGPEALSGLSIEISEEEYIAVVGPNGCGKTTFLRHLNGLLLPSQGHVFVDDLDTTDPKALGEIRQRVGMVFQNPDNQLVGMTVEEDVAFGPGNLNLPSKEIKKRIDRAVDIVGISELIKRPPHSLSSGEKQLTAIAGVLAMNPRYIAFDEPTSYLDPSGKEKVLGVIKELHKQGITVIHVTHDMDEIVVANRVLVMNEGKILADESPGTVFGKNDWLRDLGLGIPRITELIIQLRQLGVDISPDILTLEDASRELMTLINGSKTESPIRALK